MSSTQPASLIPATLLTGFLGSGKTTVLNHVLKQPIFRAGQYIRMGRALVHAAADAGILRGTESSHDSPLEGRGFEPLVPARRSQQNCDDLRARCVPGGMRMSVSWRSWRVIPISRSS